MGAFIPIAKPSVFLGMMRYLGDDVHDHASFAFLFRFLASLLAPRPLLQPIQAYLKRHLDQERTAATNTVAKAFSSTKPSRQIPP